MTIDIVLQRRRINDSLDDALGRGPAKVVGRLRVPAGEWRTFSAAFDQPRVSTRAVRLLLDVRAEDDDGPAATVWLDDIAWVEWRTPWLNGVEVPGTPVFATHVQFQNQ